MGLIGNKFRDSTAGVARALGDVPAISVPRRTSDWGNVQSPDGAAGIPGVSYPHGLADVGAWFMPQISGEMSIRIEASGRASGDLFAGMLMTATLTGAGAITALAALAVSMQAGLTGSGGVSSATITGLLNAIAAMTGSGAITATAGGIGVITAALTGTGGASGTIGAIGDMELDIVVTGTGLTTANVGQAVWNAIIDSGFTAEEIMRLLAAAMAGKVSGAAGTTVTFRDLGDTKDRIVATVDASGNRTAVTKDVS